METRGIGKILKTNKQKYDAVWQHLSNDLKRKKIGKNVVIPWWGLARSWHHPTMVAIQNSTVSTFRK